MLVSKMSFWHSRAADSRSSREPTGRTSPPRSTSWWSHCLRSWTLTATGTSAAWSWLRWVWHSVGPEERSRAAPVVKKHSWAETVVCDCLCHGLPGDPLSYPSQDSQLVVSSSENVLHTKFCPCLPATCHPSPCLQTGFDASSARRQSLPRRGCPLVFSSESQPWTPVIFCSGNVKGEQYLLQ